jgi:hypothetical protein
MTDAPSAGDPHLDGLLHLATLAFAMTLAYLSFDRIGEGQARDRLEHALKTQEKTVGEFLKTVEAKGIRMTDDQGNEHMNVLRNYVANWGHRRAICMLLTFGKFKHDIYEGKFGKCLMHWHQAQLFFAYGCYLRRWDVLVIKIAAFASCVSFLGLTGATTFRQPISKQWVVTAFVVGVITILLVVAFAWHSSSARRWLVKSHEHWRDKYTEWVNGLNTDLLKQGEKIVARRIRPPDAANLSTVEKPNA